MPFADCRVRNEGRSCSGSALPTAPISQPGIFTARRPGARARRSPGVPPSDELGVPVGLLDHSVELANALGHVVGLLLQFWHVEDRLPLDLAQAVALRLLARAGDRGDEQRMLLLHHVA